MMCFPEVCLSHLFTVHSAFLLPPCLDSSRLAGLTCTIYSYSTLQQTKTTLDSLKVEVPLPI